MLRRLKALYHLLIAIAANIYFHFPSRQLTVIGVTGTDGKTTTATLIYEILKTAGYKASMITSVHAVVAGREYDTGFHVTTPSAWWVQKYLREAAGHGDTHFVLEVTSHALDQHRVAGVRFAVGVLTNVTHEHLDWHKTFEKYLKTKISLFLKSKIVVLNRDDAEAYNKAIPKLIRKKIITYGVRRDAIIAPSTFPFKTKLPGTFNTYNCLAAIAATFKALDIDKKIVLKTISEFSGVPGRMEAVVDSPFRIIVDFAHTPNAIEQALKTVRPWAKKRLIHVFGSASERDTSKRPFMGRASAKYADVIILTEEDYRKESVDKIIDEIASGIPEDKEVYRYPDRGEAVKFAISYARPGDLIILTGKGHEKSLCRGTKEYPWSDSGEVAKIMKNYATKK